MTRVLFSIYLHDLSLWCQRRCHYSYPGTLLFNKVIFVFLYLNICYLNASLSSYGSSTGIFILWRGYTERDSASEAIWRFLMERSRSISEDRCIFWGGFLRLIECVRGFCTHQCSIIIKKSYTVTWALLINLLEQGSFRVYCTVYKYPQITCCYLTDFGH